MSKIRTLSLSDIDFSGKKLLFNDCSTLYNDELKFNTDICPLVKNCVLIQEFLFKYKVIPLTSRFTIENKTSHRLFIISDCINKFHWFGGSSIQINLTTNDIKDTEKLTDMLNKLSDNTKMTVYYAGIRAGASLVKLLLRSEAYTEKYVNVTNNKPRILHTISTNIKQVVSYTIASSFIITLSLIAPQAAIPLIAFIS